MNIKYNLKRYIAALTLLGAAFGTQNSLFAQSIGALTLEETIEIAKVRSAQAQVARFSLLSQYWNYRSYKANLLPSLNLSGNLFNYDRSIVEARNSLTGNISYVENNSLNNKLGLSIVQKIALTGGVVSVNSDLTRLDQFRNGTRTYNSNPLTINYNQPLRAFNSLKWQKKTAPRRYENSKKTYLEAMENITIRTATYFFAVLSAQAEKQRSVDDYEKRKELYAIAQKRYEIGTIKYSELLQLHLSLLNAEMRINSAVLDLDADIFSLSTYIGVSKESISSLQTPLSVPNISLDFNDVLEKAYKNSSHTLTQELKRLASEQALALAKSQRGLEADIRVNLGLSQSDPTLSGAYTNLKDREVVGLSLKLPIYDWGVSKGKVKMAEADLDVTMTEIEVAEQEFKQEILTKVLQFNNQKRQCEIAILAQNIAKERYEITTKRFENGTVTVTDLNTARNEMESAQTKYINQLRTYWTSYYEIQKISLHDFIKDCDISTQFDKLIE